ncbi:MAG TPA: hypothetical protein VN736_15930 [Candidatus Limnocylindrales bacterium]|nr:hypothetical protein [Candidatus Limnocylindrales bacterium]
MSFALYVIGFLVVVIGLSIGASMMHIAPRWIVVGDLVLIGIGIVTGVTGTRQKDPS